MGKVVGVLRATHKLEDEVNHQENGKNYFDLYKSQEIQVLKVSRFMFYIPSTNVLQVSILINRKLFKARVLFEINLTEAFLGV